MTQQGNRSVPDNPFTKKSVPMARQLLNYALGLKGKYGITDARVQISASQTKKTGVENGRLMKAVKGITHGVSVRLYSGDKTLSVSQDSLDIKQLENSILELARNIGHVPDNPNSTPIESKYLYKGPEIDLGRVDPASVSMNELENYALEIEKGVLQNQGIKAVRSVSASHSFGQSFTLASNGLESYKARTRSSAVAIPIVERDGEMVTDAEGSQANFFQDMADPADIGDRAAKKAIAKLNAKLPDSGKQPVILSPEAAETFIHSVLEAISGTAVYHKATFLKDKLGQQVISPEFNLIDDPSIYKGLASSQTDNAGMEKKPITFIGNGVLKEYLMSVSESRLLGRDYIGRNDGPTNIIVTGGSRSPDDLMSDIDEGVYITEFSGGVADVNTGKFSRQSDGFVIRNGKITDEPVSGFVLAGNLKDMFAEVVLANDTPKLPDPYVTDVIPTMRFDSLTIAGN